MGPVDPVLVVKKSTERIEVVRPLFYNEGTDNMWQSYRSSICPRLTSWFSPGIKEICRKGEGGETLGPVLTSKCSRVGKTPSSSSSPHIVNTALSPVLTSNAMIVNASACYRDINERQRRHQFQLPGTPFLRDLGHPNHPPKPF